jgi:hypothetical protein
LVLFARSVGLDDEMLHANRGWSVEEWETAGAHLFAQGLLGTTDVADAGASLRDEIEATTDALAAPLFDGATEPEITALAERLGAIAADIPGTAWSPIPTRWDCHHHRAVDPRRRPRRVSPAVRAGR